MFNGWWSVEVVSWVLGLPSQKSEVRFGDRSSAGVSYFSFNDITSNESGTMDSHYVRKCAPLAIQQRMHHQRLVRWILVSETIGLGQGP